jgi:hypothetical protein
MRQRPFVLEHLSKIAAIDPPAAGWASSEVLGIVPGRFSDAPTAIFAAGKIDHLDIAGRAGGGWQARLYEGGSTQHAAYLGGGREESNRNEIPARGIDRVTDRASQ